MAAEQSSQGRDVSEKFGGHDLHSSYDDKNAFRIVSFGPLCAAVLAVVLFVLVWPYLLQAF